MPKMKYCFKNLMKTICFCLCSLNQPVFSVCVDDYPQKILPFYWGQKGGIKGVGCESRLCICDELSFCVKTNFVDFDFAVL